MRKKCPGFTLIEMLIVVVVVGILAALLIPQFVSAMQKARQKGSMKDMNSISTAIADFITENGTAPISAPDGPLVAGDPFFQDLTDFYAKVFPQNDQWGTPFQVYSGADCEGVYTGVSNCGYDDYLVASFGRDRTNTPIDFDPLNPTTALFALTSMSSFDEDLVLWSGSWIHAPKAVQIGD